MNEREFKAIIKKSVKAQGGFALSLAAPMVSGVPDLYISMPGFIPVLLEAKWLQFGPTRKIPITPIQRKTLEWCNNSVEGSAFIICGFKKEKQILASICVYDKTHLDRGAGFKLYEGIFPINAMFNIVEVPLIA